MTGRLLKRIALAGLFLCGIVASAEAQSWPPRDFSAFASACVLQPGVQAYVAGAPVVEPAPVNRLCGCMVGELSNASQSDIDMLTKDLLNTATDAERMAYETYEDLRAFAGQALQSCSESVLAGLANPPGPAPIPAPAPMRAPEPTLPVEPVVEPAPEIATIEPIPAPEPAPIPEPTPIPEPAPISEPAPLAQTEPPAAPETQSPRMSAEARGFITACGASVAFQGYLEGLASGAADNQGSICTCLTSALMPTVAPADMALLQRDFTGVPADPSYQETESYTRTVEAAQSGLRTCMAESGVPADF